MSANYVSRGNRFVGGRRTASETTQSAGRTTARRTRPGPAPPCSTALLIEPRRFRRALDRRTPGSPPTAPRRRGRAARARRRGRGHPGRARPRGPPTAPPSCERAGSGQQLGQLAGQVAEDVGEEDDQDPAEGQQGGQQEGGQRVVVEGGPVGVEHHPEEVLGATVLVHGGIAPSARYVRFSIRRGWDGRRHWDEARHPTGEEDRPWPLSFPLPR